MIAPCGVCRELPAEPGASDVEVLDLGLGCVCLHQRGQLGGDRRPQLLDGLEDLEGGHGGGLTPLLLGGEVLAPAGQLPVLAGGVHEPLGQGHVDGELAGAGAVDAVALLAAAIGGAGCPVPIDELDALEALQLPRRHTDPDGDLLEPLQATLLDLDEPAQGPGDRRREVASGELLRPLEYGEVRVGDVDRLVRHGCILGTRRVYAYIYV